MRRLYLAIAIGAAVAAAGCAATMSVGSHIDRQRDFAQYRTFDWGVPDALPTGDPRLDQDPYFKDYLMGAVERGLAARGLELASSDRADVLVHYHANITERIDVNRTEQEHGYCDTAPCPADAVWYEAGTLILDLMDARTNTLVWRGWAQNDVEGMLRNRDTMIRTVNQAVTEMLQQLPRTR